MMIVENWRREKPEAPGVNAPESDKAKARRTIGIDKFGLLWVYEEKLGEWIEYKGETSNDS